MSDVEVKLMFKGKLGAGDKVWIHTADGQRQPGVVMGASKRSVNCSILVGEGKVIQNVKTPVDKISRRDS